MATYTMRLNEVMNLYGEDEVLGWFSSYNMNDYLTRKQIDVITARGWTPTKLAKKILNHFYMSEIGQETPALFRHFAKEYMEEIMEEMLPNIYTACIDYDPFVNEDYLEEFTRDVSSNGNATGTSNSKADNSGLGVNSDTPQGQINKEIVLAGNYASSVNASEGTSSGETITSSSNDGTSKETYSRHVKGNRGVSSSYQVLIDLFRKNIKAFDKEIIDRLNPLFMGLY